MLTSKAVEIMKDYYQEDVSQINHCLKVLEAGEKISKGENLKDSFSYQVMALSCIFHDIGIPEARKKYNSSAPKYQELEGPAVARSLMETIGIRADILERVCYIVGNHHTYESIDGVDFQILFEADMVVNLTEGWSGLDRSELKKRLETGNFTETGKKMILDCNF